MSAVVSDHRLRASLQRSCGMETDTLTIMSFLLAIFVATATLAALIVPTLRRLDRKIDVVQAGLDKKIDGVQARLEKKIDGVQARLETKIEGVQAELRMVERRLGDRIDTLSDRVARLEGRVFEVPLHGAGTEAD